MAPDQTCFDKRRRIYFDLAYTWTQLDKRWHCASFSEFLRVLREFGTFWIGSESSRASSRLDLDEMEESWQHLVFRLDYRWILELQNCKITKSQITNSPWLRSRRIANHKVPFLCWPWIISNTKSITNTNHKDFHPRLRIFKSQMPILHWRCLEHILGTGCDGGKSSRNNNWDCRTYRWDWEENNFRPMIVHQQLDWVAIAGIPIIFFTFIILLRWLRNISMSSPPCRKI